MDLSKFRELKQFVSDRPIFSVLDIIRPEAALPPFLHQIPRNAKKTSSTLFAYDRIRAEGLHRLGLICQEHSGNLLPKQSYTLCRGDRLSFGRRLGRGCC